MPVQRYCGSATGARGCVSDPWVGQSSSEVRHRHRDEHPAHQKDEEQQHARGESDDHSRRDRQPREMSSRQPGYTDGADDSPQRRR